MSSHLARTGYTFEGIGDLSAGAVLLGYDRAIFSGNSSKTCCVTGRRQRRVF